MQSVFLRQQGCLSSAAGMALSTTLAMAFAGRAFFKLGTEIYAVKLSSRREFVITPYLAGERSINYA